MEILQQSISVLVVLGMLGAALWWLRRQGVARLRGPMGRQAQRRLQHLERMPLTAQHSLCLVRAVDRVLLISVSPGGCNLMESWPQQQIHLGAAGAPDGSEVTR